MGSNNSENSSNSSSESQKIVEEIIDDILTETFIQIETKSYKWEAVELYHERLMKALKEVLNVYEMPKPTTDHSHIIAAWEKDKPAKPSCPDSLITNFI
jgi:hypothetical protein